MSIAEKKVLEHLTNTGAATKLELKEATGHGKDHVQAAITKLVAQGRVQATAARKKHNSNRNHVVFAALQVAPKPVVHKPAPDSQSLNVFEHGSLYNRVHELEGQLARLNKTCTDLRDELDDVIERQDETSDRLQAYSTTVSQVAGKQDQQARRLNDCEGWVDECNSRLTALEPQPAVDPVYVEIEKDITDKLGGQIRPERLRVIIEEVYAERVK
jgi:hypothetical protein